MNDICDRGVWLSDYQRRDAIGMKGSTKAVLMASTFRSRDSGGCRKKIVDCGRIPKCQVCKVPWDAALRRSEGLKKRRGPTKTTGSIKRWICYGVWITAGLKQENGRCWNFVMRRVGSRGQKLTTGRARRRWLIVLPRCAPR